MANKRSIKEIYNDIKGEETKKFQDPADLIADLKANYLTELARRFLATEEINNRTREYLYNEIKGEIAFARNNNLGQEGLINTALKNSKEKIGEKVYNLLDTIRNEVIEEELERDREQLAQ